MDNGQQRLLNDISELISNKEVTTTINLPITKDNYYGETFVSREDFDTDDLYDLVDYLNEYDTKDGIYNITECDYGDIDVVINNKAIELIIYTDEDITAIIMYEIFSKIDEALSLYVLPLSKDYVLWVDKNNIMIEVIKNQKV